MMLIRTDNGYLISSAERDLLLRYLKSLSQDELHGDPVDMDVLLARAEEWEMHQRIPYTPEGADIKVTHIPLKNGKTVTVRIAEWIEPTDEQLAAYADQVRAAVYARMDEALHQIDPLIDLKPRWDDDDE